MSPTTTPDVAFYDVHSRRRKTDGEMYLKDAQLMVGGDRIVLKNGVAHKIPAAVALIANQRVDLYVIPSEDQTPPEPVLLDGPGAPMQESEFEALPPNAVGAETDDVLAVAAPQVGDIDPVTGHRIPPGRGELSDEEIAARKAAGAAYLQTLPAHEIGTSTGAGEGDVEVISDTAGGVTVAKTETAAAPAFPQDPARIAKLAPDQRVQPGQVETPAADDDAARAAAVEAALQGEQLHPGDGVPKGEGVTRETEITGDGLEQLEKADLLKIADDLDIDDVNGRHGEKTIIGKIRARRAQLASE